MVNNASKFTRNRTDALSITNQRIKRILWYIIECHQIFINDNKTYSKDWVHQNTTLHFEDYLKFEFLDNYLIPNKSLLKEVFSELEELHFSAETQKRYIDRDGKQKPDKIDIYINQFGLQEVWNSQDENIYFAIECKRIKHLSDARDYVADIEKFCNRSHINTRLPFEGQIAFIENPKLTQTIIVDKINSTLHSNNLITTNSYLAETEIHKKLNCAFYSIHKKNFSPNQQFAIFHLMLDYSKVVVD